MKNNDEQAGSKHNYIFPDFFAKFMSKVDQRTQYEASMLSISFMMVGIVLSGVYAVIYMNIALWFKIVVGINCFFGLVLMWSFLVNTYQQYQSYMQVLDFQTDMKGGNNGN